MGKQIRLTPQMQQELISRFQLCERLVEFGWLPNSPILDLGQDFNVDVYLQGQATGVTFQVQEKSITNLHKRRKGDYLVYDDFKVKDLKHWETFSFPVVLIVWDVKLREGRWTLINDVILDLDQRLPNWRTNKSKARVHIPWDNTTDDTGLICLQRNVGKIVYPLIAKGRQLELEGLTLRHLETPEGEATLVAFERFLKEGEPVTIKGKFIQEIKLSEWWMPWLGSGHHVAELSIRPRLSSETLPVSIGILSLDGKTASIPSIELKVIKPGQETVTLSNEHQFSSLHFRLTIQEPANYTLYSKANNWGANVCETRNIMMFLEAITIGGTLRLTFLTLDNAPLDISIPPNPEKFSDYFTPELLQVIDKLCTIQNKTGKFLSITSGGDIDIREVNELMSIIEQGKAVVKPKELTIELEKKVLEILLDIYRRGELIHLGITDDESYIELLDQKIQLGRMTRHITGNINMSVDKLEQAVAGLAPDESMTLKFVDIEVVEIFPDWFIREAERLSQLLIQNFGAEKVYLFGSLVWSEVHTPETDIDLAVSGLPAERYLEAVSYLERESNFPVDLVELNKLPDPLHQRIITEGKLLSESEPVAAFS